MRFSVLATIFATFVTLVVAIPTPLAGEASLSVVPAVKTPASSSALLHHATSVHRKTPGDESRTVVHPKTTKHSAINMIRQGISRQDNGPTICTGNCAEGTHQSTLTLKPNFGGVEFEEDFRKSRLYKRWIGCPLLSTIQLATDLSVEALVTHSATKGEGEEILSGDVQSCAFGF